RTRAADQEGCPAGPRPAARGRNRRPHIGLGPDALVRLALRLGVLPAAYYLGWVLSYAQGYWEHYDAKPGDHYANSVSSYHRLYNLLWFNNGYHQEHHWDPKHHWTRMHQLHEQLRPRLVEHGTRMLRGPHC